MKQPIVGKTYDIAHSRKGKFRAKVLEIASPWIKVEIVKGKARNMASEAHEVGDTLTIRDEHSSFTLVK